MLFLISLNLFPQSFGFGDYDEEDEFPGLPASNQGFSLFDTGIEIKINGKAEAQLKLFFEEINFNETIRQGNIFNGSLNFSASGSFADAVINLDITPSYVPISIDEAYVRAFFGSLSITGGVRKLSWGKADSFGPLDVINPLDYSDLSNISDPQSIKIARPMLHASYRINYASRLEAVFIPWFEEHKFANTGMWMPMQITGLPDMAADYAAQVFYSLTSLPLPDAARQLILRDMEAWINSGALNNFYPDTNYLNYAQAGLRYTTSIRSNDLGFQYYYGRLGRPAVTITETGFVPPLGFNTDLIKLNIAYNPYHHFGVDLARVIGSFNIRAEAGANITSDLDGRDGSVYNPALVWSLGFDRGFSGFNINVQGSGNIILFHNNINSSPMLDTQAGSNMTQTRLTLVLSRSFFRDELDLKLTSLWGIEDRDFLFMPGIYWSKDSFYAELSAGFFLGDENGELGQYKNNGFFKILLGYRF